MTAQAPPGIEPAASPTALFTNRHGGVSSGPYTSLNLGDHVGDDLPAVTENRRRASAQLAGAPVVWMQQVHGNAVAVVDGPQDASVPEVDALVTTAPGLALGVLVADCVPVLLAAPGAAAVAHAGRKGLQLGVVPAVLRVLTDLGFPPHALTVQLGPSACGACYEVPEAMRDEVAAVAPAAATTTRAGTPGLDIRAGLVEQLSAAGVERIEVSDICTIESPDHFSYRRDGVTGRTAGLVRCVSRTA